MTESGRAALALAVKNQTIHLAWGSGDADWDDSPAAPDTDATELENEIGRVYAFNSLFVTPDTEGSILLPDNNRYTVSTDPTRHLYLDFKFGFTDGVGSTIRELGIFIGGVVKDSVAPGKTYLLPADLESPGILLMLEHREALLRKASERVEMQWVISL
jgi:hypothetical protein